MHIAAALISALFLTACASERIVLLPSSDAQPSAIVVRNLQGERQTEQWIDQPYAESVRRSGYNRVMQIEPEQIKQRYVALLDAQPPRARSYTLYFESGTDTLTPASIIAFEQAKAEFLTRPAAEITLIGHTDRVGEMADNEALAQRRVNAVQVLLEAAGVTAAAIDTASRGEREPLVPTADGVDEPLNRRVEISLR